MDQCVYHKISGSKFIFIVLCVDILLASSDIGLSQKPYIDKVLCRFGIQSCA